MTPRYHRPILKLVKMLLKYEVRMDKKYVDTIEHYGVYQAMSNAILYGQLLDEHYKTQI